MNKYAQKVSSLSLSDRRIVYDFISTTALFENSIRAVSTGTAYQNNFRSEYVQNR
jgi:hypothetical protein